MKRTLRAACAAFVTAAIATGCSAPKDRAGPPLVKSNAKFPASTGPQPRVIVVGGGIAGLSAAYELQKRGISSTMIESTDMFGGRVFTARYGEGLFAEAGLQEMWADNPLLKIARELEVPLDEEVSEPYSSIVINGKYHPYVQSSSDAYFSSFLSAEEKKALKAWMQRAKTLRDSAKKQGLKNTEIAKLEEISFAAWVGSAKLPKKVSDWIRMTLECELASDWEGFSALEGLLEFGIFLGGGEKNYHVRGGNSRLIDAIVENLRGPKITNATVTRVEHHTGPDGKIKARVTYVRNQQIESVEAERVVVAVPFTRVHQILFDPPLAEDKWQGIFTLNRGQYTVVHLLMDKKARSLWNVDGQSPFPVLTDGTLGVIYGVMHESPESQPNEVFSLLVHGAAANAFHMIPREMKIKEVTAKLDAMWPGFGKYMREAHVYSYHPAAIAVWPPGRSPIDARAEKLREPENGVYIVGDWTYSGHSDGAAISGMNAGQKIADELVSKR